MFLGGSRFIPIMVAFIDISICNWDGESDWPMIKKSSNSWLG